MNTPKEIAHYTFAKLRTAATETCEADIVQMIESAIESDRAQRAEAIEVLTDAAMGWADHVLGNMESMREDDEDRDTDQAEIDAIHAAIDALSKEG